MAVTDAVAEVGHDRLTQAPVTYLENVLCSVGRWTPNLFGDGEGPPQHSSRRYQRDTRVFLISRS